MIMFTHIIEPVDIWPLTEISRKKHLTRLVSKHVILTRRFSAKF